MATRRIGASIASGPGLEVSVVGVGCNNFGSRIDAAAAQIVVDTAIELGLTHFDTAEMYGGGRSEEFLGAALGSRRDQAVIATKYSPRAGEQPYRPGALRDRIIEAAEGSLQRLGTDRIDLYYQHLPDVDAPIDEALEALDSLVRGGKVLTIASSNDNEPQVRAADDAATKLGTARFVASQIHWNLLHREEERELVPALRGLGQGIVPYFPLASGLLTGKYRRDEPFPEGTRLAGSPQLAQAVDDGTFAKLESLAAFASDHGHSLLELAVSWLASQVGVVSVIAGATKPEQVRANAAAAAWMLGTDELAEIDALLA